MKWGIWGSVLMLLVSAMLGLPAGARAAEGEIAVTDVDMSRWTAPDAANRVFYEIFTGSFSDADGDGTGDLKGILNRLDYLNDGDPASGKSLGVEGLWLTPVFASPSYHKYDVTDYYTIDPAFGTMEDLQALIDGCHERGIRLILDLPINHTGSRNRWFKQFTWSRQMNDPLGACYDWYVCVTEEEKLAGHTYYPVKGQPVFYEGNFSRDMPELNFDCGEVRQEVLNIARTYLEMGVDGFRFDAAKYVYLNDHERSAEFWQWYTDEIRKIRPDAYLVAEVWDSDAVTDRYYAAMDCFDFTVSQTAGLIAETAQAGDVNRYTAYVEKYLASVREKRADAGIVPFLANHDTDRAAGYLPVTNGRMQMAANLYLLGPGTPFIYYGEEIGMKGSRGGAQTDANRRLAMRWGDGDPVKDPVGTTYEESKQTQATVASAAGENWSLYTYYKRLLMIRAANPEIARGDYRSLNLKDTKLGGFLSSWEGSTVLVLHNTTQRTLTLDLSQVPDAPAGELAAFIGMGTAPLEGTVVTLEGQTSAVIR